MNKQDQKIKQNQKANKITVSSKMKNNTKISTVSSETITVFPEKEYFELDDEQEILESLGFDDELEVLAH